uniref:Lipoprotein n=1 Tax=Acidobacterium capsulatum TaxID=33075 RepID=A0A7V4XUG4_9BACT
MKPRNWKLLGIALLALSTSMALAQESGRTIQQRKHAQQHRIAQGVRSGQLTRRESRNLKAREAGIRHEERHMRANHDGHLTPSNRARIQRQQNRTSRAIYNKKHNAAHRPY